MNHLELRVGEEVPDRGYVEELVRRQVAKLEARTPEVITSCHVAIERPMQHPRTGTGWRVRVEVRFDNAPPFVVRREPGDGIVNEELATVINEVFAATIRKARELKRRMKGQRKRHPAQQIDGIVTELHPDYGILFSADGRKIYFHANSVVERAFADVRVGMGVAFEEEEGLEGPQASSVRVIDRRGSGQVVGRPPVSAE